MNLHQMWEKCMELSFICPPNPLMEWIIIQLSGFITKILGRLIFNFVSVFLLIVMNE